MEVIQLFLIILWTILMVVVISMVFTSDQVNNEKVIK
jgi:hypothetical protein